MGFRIGYAPEMRVVHHYDPKRATPSYYRDAAVRLRPHAVRHGTRRKVRTKSAAGRQVCAALRVDARRRFG